MNRNNNIYNKNEVENKLKDFKKGQDYSVSPADDGKQVYNFFSDELKNFWGDDRIVVNRVVETDSNKDWDYYGQFENYQDGSYRSFQSWSGKNFRQSESYKLKTWWERDFSFYRDPEAIGESLEHGRIGGKYDPKQIEPNHDLKWKYNQLTDKLNSLLARPESDFGVNGKEKREHEIAEVKKDIAAIESAIKKEKNHNEISYQPDWIKCPVCDKTFNKNTEVWGVQGESGFQPTCCHSCAKEFAYRCGGRIIKSGSDEYYRKDLQQKGRMGRGEKGSWVDNSNLEKENQELRQQLAEVQKQLTEVLEELKKLKTNVNGKESKKLSQQIVQNEKLIKEGEGVSVAEVQEQVNKSQALMKEFNNVSSTNDRGSMIPYVIGGSMVLALVGIVSYFLLKKSKRK